MIQVQKKDIIVSIAKLLKEKDRGMKMDVVRALATIGPPAKCAAELEFPTKSGHGVKLYSVCSYSAGETYPSEE